MEHSVAAYLARLPKRKAEQLWEEWVINDEIPPHISFELVEILKLRVKECADEERAP